MLRDKVLHLDIDLYAVFLGSSLEIIICECAYHAWTSGVHSIPVLFLVILLTFVSVVGNGVPGLPRRPSYPNLDLLMGEEVRVQVYALLIVRPASPVRGIRINNRLLIVIIKHMIFQCGDYLHLHTVAFSDIHSTSFRCRLAGMDRSITIYSSLRKDEFYVRNPGLLRAEIEGMRRVADNGETRHDL
jgi:hypothetical protein